MMVVQTIHYQIIGYLVNYELEMMWKEVVVDLFEVISKHLPKASKETIKNTSQNSYPLS